MGTSLDRLEGGYQMQVSSDLNTQDSLQVQARHRLSRTPDFLLPFLERGCCSFSSDALDLHGSVWMSGIDEIDKPSGTRSPRPESVLRGTGSARTGTKSAKADLFPSRPGQGAAIQLSLNPLARHSSCGSGRRRSIEKAVQAKTSTNREPATAGGNVASNIWSTLAIAWGATGICGTHFFDCI